MQATGDVTAKLFEMSQSRWHRWTTIFLSLAWYELQKHALPRVC